MAHGLDFELSVGVGGSPEVFTKLAGCTTNGLDTSKETIDNTTKDHNLRRNLLARGGMSSLSTSLSGFVEAGNVLLQQMQTDVEAGTIRNYQINVPDFMSYTGPFQGSSFGLTGDKGEAVGFSVTLDSAGAIAMAAL